MTTFLNIGCGAKTSSRAGVVNIDWSIALRIRSNPILRAIAPILMRGDRLRRFRALPQNIRVHNLTRGLPFPDGSVDVVYHSHLLEHLDRDIAVSFAQEAHRVLKPGGIHRIVVPDLEQIVRNYASHLHACEQDRTEIARHDDLVADLLEQSVRKEAWGTSQQSWGRRMLENTLLGDARRRGETHQWMYDRFNLSSLLGRVGFEDIALCMHNTSRIPGWLEYGLDQNMDGSEYKAGSLYVEAYK